MVTGKGTKMTDAATSSIERRLQALEDQIAIYQTVCGYGYAIDACNGEAVGALHAEDATYAVGDMGVFQGRAGVVGIASDPGHVAMVAAGCGHISTLPFVVLDGDRAVATCHTMVMRKGEDGYYAFRVSASRLQLSRKVGGGWQIDHRQNYLLDGNPAGPAMLGRLNQGPQAA